MIVSHAHRFIFIKSRKVAGTSVEVFLSRFCGEDDIITPLGADEALREGMGGRNFWFSTPGRGNRLLRLWGKLLGRPSLGYRGYYPHIPAKEIRRLVGDEIWNSYYKFSIERNPWDRQVSLYHWHYRDRGAKPSFDVFIRSPLHRKISSNFDTYAIDGQVAADYVCRYESLERDLQRVLDEIGIDAKVELPKAKASHRNGRSWRDYYTPTTRDIVGRWYAREIETFGYSF
ncbi:MAG TPA: sulfotransferase family 2 domain-containing protein [Methyloceanibacter sp.]|nr:sulfotransferase family 2 domain-containing protein [Methyloceanibacter sp.]